MGGKTLVKNTLVFGIILLFIVSAVSPMVIGLKSDTVDVERDEFLDNLAFYYYDGDDSFKFEYYKEYFQSDSLEIADLEEITIPVESPQTSVSSGPMDSPWSMKCHDTHHTSRSPYSTEHNPGLEKWRFLEDHWIDIGPVIDNDGIIYIADSWGDVSAIYPNGTLKWKFTTDGQIMGSTPAIDEDGTIYIGSWDDYLYALNPNGTMKWRFFASDTVATSPAIGEDGTIYIGIMGPDFDTGRIWAVNPNGTGKWYYDTDFWIVSDPAIGDDGTVYIGSGDSFFYALYPNGTLRWRFQTGYEIHSHPSIADDGTIYIASWDGYLYALYPNGTKKWQCDAGEYSTSNPSIAEDGTIYVASDRLYAIYPNGTSKWSFEFGSGGYVFKSSPAISADGTVYVGTNINGVDGGDIIAVNPDGTERWRKKIALEWVDSSPCIGEDGTVYIGSTYDQGRGYLHAFGSVESNEPPETPTISGETNGKPRVEYAYKLRVIDPDNNPISFYIEWGDETHTGWTFERASGENCYYGHTWSTQGDYTIRAKAKDVLGEESDWATLEVTMPMNQQLNNWWFLQFLQNHPRMFPILRHLFRLE